VKSDLRNVAVAGAVFAGSRNRPLRTLLVPAPLVIVIMICPLTAKSR
jgi:hypothetical protein